MEEEGCGVLVYLQKSAPKVSAELDILSGKKEAIHVDKGAIGLPDDLREFGIGAQILLDQGVRQIRLLTSKTSRIRGVDGYGLSVVDHVLIPPKSESNL
jgi:3,4-dihydroxy 2-butanone 4-phosphate synthase/GTP cyclohydrolase II